MITVDFAKELRPRDAVAPTCMCMISPAPHITQGGGAAPDEYRSAQRIAVIFQNSAFGLRAWGRAWMASPRSATVSVIPLGAALRFDPRHPKTSYGRCEKGQRR